MVGTNPSVRDKMHQVLLTTTDFVEVLLFDSVKEDSVNLLEKAWIRFLKEDLKAYIE